MLVTIPNEDVVWAARSSVDRILEMDLYILRQEKYTCELNRFCGDLAIACTYEHELATVFVLAVIPIFSNKIANRCYMIGD